MLFSRADCDAPCFDQLKATHLRASPKQQGLLGVLIQLIKTWPLTIGPCLSLGFEFSFFSLVESFGAIFIGLKTILFSKFQKLLNFNKAFQKNAGTIITSRKQCMQFYLNIGLVALLSKESQLTNLLTNQTP